MTGVQNATEQDVAMIGKVIAEANKAMDAGKVGIGAALVWRGEILAIDHNNFEESGDITAHAEMTVFRKAARRLSAMSDEEKADLTLYSTLEPCLMCFSASYFVGIKRIVYSALNVDGGDEVTVMRDTTTEYVNQHLVKGPIELIPGVCRNDGIKLLKRMEKDAKE